MLRVLVLVTAFIIYGSLYPWQFHHTALPGSPLWVLLHSWPQRFNRFVLKDIAVNVALYMPFGAAAFLWLSKRSAVIGAALAVVLAGLLSASMEMLQLFDGQRVCSLLDLVLNVTGAAVGAAGASLLRRAGARVPAIPERASAPLFLLACWLGGQTFPFMPDFSRAHLAHKLGGFLMAHGRFVTFITDLSGWIIAARMIEAGFGKDVSRACLPALFLVLPARLFIAERSLTWADCFAAGLAWILWLAWFSGNPRSDRDLAALALAVLLFYGLAPFRLVPEPQPFSWIPYRALFTTDWQSGFAVFLWKSFAYGAALWLLIDAGLSIRAATVLVASMLGGIEIVQRHLPGHVAETTDPLHALVLSWILKHLHTAPSVAAAPRKKYASG